MTLYSPLGTQIEAPAHLHEGASTLDLMPSDQFWGDACLIRVDRQVIGAESLNPHAERSSGPNSLILETGWSRHWGTDGYFTHFPVLSIDAARALDKPFFPSMIPANRPLMHRVRHVCGTATLQSQ